MRTSIFFSASSCSCGMMGCLGFCSQDTNLARTTGPFAIVEVHLVFCIFSFVFMFSSKLGMLFLHLRIFEVQMYEIEWHNPSLHKRTISIISNNLFPFALPSYSCHRHQIKRLKKTLQLDSLYSDSLLFNRLIACNWSNEKLSFNE